MMFTFALPSNKTFSTMFFPTCTWITTIRLSTCVNAVSTLECVSITMATLGSNITLVTILGFFGFSFFHIFFLRFGVIFNN